MENTSGQGKAAVVPEEVKGLAWGAFLWSWLWGLFNRTWLALLVFVPIVGLVMWIMLLFKGREWAWRNKRWDSVEHFNRVQRKWAKAGLIVLCIPFVLGIVAAIVIPMMGDDGGTQLTALKQTAPARPRPATPVAAPPPVVAPAPAPIARVAQQAASAAPEEHVMTPEVKADSPKVREADGSSGRESNKNEVKRPPTMEAEAQLPESSKEPVAAAEPEKPLAPPENVITPKFNDLVTAVMYRDQEAVTQLLELGWWVDKPSAKGITPIMEAVLIGDAPMAELLLKHGANPNAVARGSSALQFARRNRDAVMEKLLRRYGATGE